MKGYKALKKGWVCRDMQYEIGKSYEMEEEPIMCERGYHFCMNPIDVFGYYDMDSDTVIAEVEAYGEIKQEGTKFCTNKIKIVKEFTKKQLQALILDGNNNTGKDNTGDCNSGNRNSGYGNSGNRNSGYGNSGYGNSGNRNSGDCNSGNCNSGNRNSGYGNSGNRNSGIFNTDEPKMRAFNKEADMTYTDFINGISYSFYALCKRISEKNLIDGDWDKIEAMPNYDADIFFEITGLRREKK